VEQVALNRHVSPQQAAVILMAGKRWIVNSVSEAQDGLTTIWRVVASKWQRELRFQASNATPAERPVCFPAQFLRWTALGSSGCY